MKEIDIQTLPIKVQDQVRNSLTVYPKTYVTLENGEFTHTACLSLDTRKKAPDFKTFEIKNTDIYTLEQIRENTNQLPDFNSF